MTRRLLAASPDYLERRGNPAHPQDLLEHDLILYTLADNWNEFSFKKGDDTLSIKVDGGILANDGQLICKAARDGLGNRNTSSATQRRKRPWPTTTKPCRRICSLALTIAFTRMIGRPSSTR
ncbi:hypothetical protein G6L11_28025 [Agrobacterium tumefaciens]|nr:hypothetical protein [Agrobacterium tumefaciens]NTA73125.1 hypothetical protein [Agrobacterium tumefaciens]